jgi:serine/threonine protein kinase
MRLEQFHTRNYIHRDVKPENFLMGLEENSHVVYLVDYGLSRRYRDPKTQSHIPYKENKPLTGTIRLLCLYLGN